MIQMIIIKRLLIKIEMHLIMHLNTCSCLKCTKCFYLVMCLFAIEAAEASLKTSVVVQDPHVMF